MHQDPEHEDYDDDEYNYYPEEYNEHGYPQQFKFDWNSWELWLKDALKDIMDNSTDNTLYVSFTNNQSADAQVEFFGNNYNDDALWKRKYFIKKDVEIAYKNHIQSNAKHILKEPSYYKGMFEILN